MAENEKLLALLCLSEDQNLSNPRLVRWTPHMQLVQRLLMAHDRRIRSLDSQLRELTEHLDSTREVWHMQLDSIRNGIIRLNLHLEFVSVATMTAAFPAGMLISCFVICYIFVSSHNHALLGDAAILVTVQEGSSRCSSVHPSQVPLLHAASDAVMTLFVVQLYLV